MDDWYESMLKHYKGLIGSIPIQGVVYFGSSTVPDDVADTLIQRGLEVRPWNRWDDQFMEFQGVMDDPIQED